MTAIINNTELNFSLNMCQLYKLSTVDIELYRDFFVLYNEREKGVADRAQLLYIAYFCANLDSSSKLSEEQFYELLENDLTALDEIYNALFHKKTDWNFAEIFERPSKNAIRYPKGYQLADVEDFYTFFVLNIGVGDETFWKTDIEFLNNVAINKNAYDSYINFELEKKR